ncbi:AI-2E family transporter [Propionibacterium sp.]|uniref:AI-2E family transporter n=1 Tax=Propionibacterium sp. TaxID=1977903 RepID=UPI0039EC52D4
MPAFSLGRRNNRPEHSGHPGDEAPPEARAEIHRRPTAPADPSETDGDMVPRSLRIAAAWSWRVLVVVAGMGVVWWLGGQLSEVVIPLMAAILLTAALAPMNGLLRHHSWPPWAAALASLLLLVLILCGLLTLVGTQIAVQWQELVQQTVEVMQSALTWLSTGPLHISHEQATGWLDQVRQRVVSSQDEIARIAAAFGSGIGRFFAGLAMTLFATFFFLKDGSRMSGAIRSTVPRVSRSTLMPGFEAGWQSLVSYVRAAVIVAAVDGVGAGLGAFFLGSNLWLAITALTFVSAFVPIVGALISGIIAVTVTLVTLGFVKAIIMLIVFIGVMQLEAHVLQPLLLGRAVSIHPLMVLVGIAVGISVAGIVGGVFAIPLVAFAFGFVRSMHGYGEQGSFGDVEDAIPGPGDEMLDDDPRQAEDKEESSSNN